MIFKVLFLVTALSFSYSSFSIDKVIYGLDNRELVQYADRQINKLAKSTLAMIPVKNFKQTRYIPETDTYAVKVQTLAESMQSEKIGLCKSERFRDTPVLSTCSAFLVGDKHIVTAGHCVDGKDKCLLNKWVFDYNFESYDERSKEVLLESKNIFSCRRVIAHSLNKTTGSDYALIELDRKVEGRKPLKFRRSHRVNIDANLLVIGHPSGLPSMATSNGRIRENHKKHFFVANTDTYGGNSGSVVFDMKSELVEGILVRGEKDYYLDEVMNCIRSTKCKSHKCRGEDITRITAIKELRYIR